MKYVQNIFGEEQYIPRNIEEEHIDHKEHIDPVKYVQDLFGEEHYISKNFQ